MPEADWPEAEPLRDALRRGDDLLVRTGPILRHLLSTLDHSLMSDEIVARIRGMMIHIARQILRAQAETTGEEGCESFADEHERAYSERLFDLPALLRHCHALALEWQFVGRLSERYALDPVLSPILQQMVADETPEIASSAMAALAAQARFAQSQRRMELPIGELPADHFHEVLLAWRRLQPGNSPDAMAAAEAKMRANYHEAASRQALLARLIAAMGSKSGEALDLERAGAALFLTALSTRSGQSRDLATISTNEQMISRLFLGLRAAGLRPAEIDALALRIHPDVTPPRGIDDLGTREASQLLAQFSAGEG